MPISLTGTTGHMVRAEERRNEIIVVAFHVAMPVAFTLLGLVLVRENPLHARAGILIASAAVFLYGAIMSLVLRYVRYRRQYKYITTGFDVVVLTALLWSLGSFRTFKAPALLLYFLIVGLASLRFSTRLTVFAGVACLLAYISMAVAAFTLGTVEPGTLAESYVAAEVVSVQGIVQYGVFSAATLTTLGFASSGYRKIMARAVMNELKSARKAHRQEEFADTLRRFVSSQMANVILETGLPMAGEERQATVLFCGIQSFLRIARGMTPVEVVSFLNDYFGRMTEVVFDHGGMLDKYIGDEFIAVFGVPVSTDRDAERAVLCALKMRDALATLNGERELAGKEQIRIRVGIDTGLVLAGNVGSELRSDFTVIGSTVNRAKRIEQLNKQFETDVLISDTTYQHVRGTVAVRAQPEVSLPDLEDTVRAYHALEVAAV